jgi:hypothetical protein
MGRGSVHMNFKDAHQTRQIVCSIPWDCGRCYVPKTGKYLEARVKEYRYNLTQGLLEKLNLALHAHEEVH